MSKTIISPGLSASCSETFVLLLIMLKHLRVSKVGGEKPEVFKLWFETVSMKKKHRHSCISLINIIHLLHACNNFPFPPSKTTWQNTMNFSTWAKASIMRLLSICCFLRWDWKKFPRDKSWNFVALKRLSEVFFHGRSAFLLHLSSLHMSTGLTSLHLSWTSTVKSM